MTGDLILACAIEVKVEVLVFGDRWHLLPVREHGSVRIRLSSAAAQLRGE